MNIAKLTEQYINDHPATRDCFRQGLINYSALARQIAKESELEKKHFDAILIACRRYFRKIEKDHPHEEKIVTLLKKSKLAVQNKIIDVLVDKNIFFNQIIQLQKEVKRRGESLNIIEGSQTVTMITSEEFLPIIKKIFKGKAIKVYQKLALVTMKSSLDLRDTPGVIAYVSSLLAQNGINLIEIMSTHTDTLMVIEEKDIGNVMQVLNL